MGPLSSPPQSAPLGIVYTCITVAITGFAYLLGLLYATPDIEAAIDGENAAISSYVTACGSAVGKILANLLISNFFFAGPSQRGTSYRDAPSPESESHVSTNLLSLTPSPSLRDELPDGNL